MGLGKNDLSSIHESLEHLTTQVKKISDDRTSGTAAKEREIVRLQQEKVAAEIELDRVKEKNARETREIDHKIGLHRKRVEQEIELAKREQVVTLREENLVADRERFETQMKFIQDRMEGELSRLSTLTSEVLSRLPTVNVDRRELSLVDRPAQGR